MIEYSPIEKHKGVPLWPTFIIYMYKFNFGQSVWDKTSIVIGNLMETHWEPNRIKSNIPPPPLPHTKQKNT